MNTDWQKYKLRKLMTELIRTKNNKKYSIIYADPPWKYNPRNNSNTSFGKGTPYPTMTIEEIKNFNINKFAADNCALFLWVTFPKLEIGMEVIKAWGFDYKTLGFSWIKTNFKNKKPFFGIGYYTKSNCEICLLGIKGKLKPISNKVSSVIISPRQHHSKKPDLIASKIVQLFGNLPRIELFARDKKEGWDVYGNELNQGGSNLKII